MFIHSGLAWPGPASAHYLLSTTILTLCSVDWTDVMLLCHWQTDCVCVCVCDSVSKRCCTSTMKVFLTSMLLMTLVIQHCTLLPSGLMVFQSQSLSLSLYLSVCLSVCVCLCVGHMPWYARITVHVTSSSCWHCIISSQLSCHVLWLWESCSHVCVRPSAV